MNIRIKELPQAEQPRERLMRLGAEALSLAELIAIILSTGTKGKSVLVLAQELVATFRDLPSLLGASVEELMKVHGMGRTKAIKLKAAFGIAVLNGQSSIELRPQIKTPQEAFLQIKEVVALEKREVLLVILKDIKQRLIRWERVSMGTLSEVLAHPREVFSPAIRHGAHSMVLVHNHPSGDLTPSKADLNLTRHLVLASKVLGIDLDDHIIVSKHRFCSLLQENPELF